MTKTSENTFRVRVRPDGRRFQVTVYDFRGSNLTPEGQDDRVQFVLETLPPNTSPSRAYSTGDLIYAGPNPETITGVLRRYFGENAVEYHSEFESYLNDPEIPTHE